LRELKIVALAVHAADDSADARQESSQERSAWSARSYEGMGGGKPERCHEESAALVEHAYWIT
jgi:hypothetical protein